MKTERLSLQRQAVGRWRESERSRKALILMQICASAKLEKG